MRKTTLAVKTLPASTKGRANESNCFKDLAVRIIIVFKSTPSGNKLVGMLNLMDMKFASKFF
eukprot:465513-Pelagomonas_calceolata.AAC.1